MPRISILKDAWSFNQITWKTLWSIYLKYKHNWIYFCKTIILISLKYHYNLKLKKLGPHNSLRYPSWNGNGTFRKFIAHLWTRGISYCVILLFEFHESRRKRQSKCMEYKIHQHKYHLIICFKIWPVSIDDRKYIVKIKYMKYFIVLYFSIDYYNITIIFWIDCFVGSRCMVLYTSGINNCM